MILHPLRTLLELDIRDIALVTNPADIPAFKALLGDGSSRTCCIHYLPQPEPAGVAQGLLLAADFLAGSSSILILGDNFFKASSPALFREALASAADEAVLFCRELARPGDYGVLRRNASGQPQSIVEKPRDAASGLVITGLYGYPADAPSFAARLRPSSRGELEISDLNQLYLEAGRLHAFDLPEDCVWLDLGTHTGLEQAKAL
jgi:glucose-1-phosphate thymidylyltransferase